MTPSVEPTTVTAPGLTVVPAKLLDGGEVVVLAIKPSGWFCLLTSLPVLVVAGAFSVAAGLAGERLPGPLGAGSVMLFWLAVSVARLILAWLRWMGRLYVLTNRRILRVGGVFRAEVSACPLRHIAQALVTVSPLERPLGVGSLSFDSSDPAASQTHWAHINYPLEVQQVVNETIAQAR